jgi:hypothetical protein
MRKHRKSAKRKSPRRKQKKTFRPPRTPKALFATSRKFQDQWNRAVQVPSEMRSQGLSLAQASRQLGISSRTVLRLGGSAFKKKRGRYEVKPTDRLLRILLIPSEKGLREIAVNDSQQASLVGSYWSALEKYLVRGDASALNKLSRKRIKDSSGKRIKLLFDLNELKRQASAGVLQFESLYGRTA